MKTNNAIWSKWIRLASGLMAVMFLTLSFVGQASAKILFEDDLFLNVQSEGIILDSNNNAASGSDITLQFGNTGATDGTMKYNTTTKNLTIDTNGNNVSFSNDNITTTGEAQFQGASHVRIREVAFAAFSGATAPQCNYVNEVAIDTTTKALYVCTATGSPGGTWKSADNNPAAGTSTGNTLTWNGSAWVESNALTNNAGTVTVTNGNTFTANGPINLGDGGDGIAIDSNTWDISSAGAASGLTGIISTGTINFSGATSLSIPQGIGNPGTCTVGQLFYNTTTNATYECTATNTWTIFAAGAQSLQTAYNTGASITTAGGTPIAFTLTNGGFNITGAGATSIGNNTGTVAVDSTTWDISTAGVASGLTGITSANGTISLNNNSAASTTSIGTGTTTGTVSIGGGSDQVAVDSSTWDITGAGVASGLTGVTSTGTVNFSGTGQTRLREVASISAATCTTAGEVAVDTTSKVLYICTSPGSPGIWKADSNNTEVMTFYPEYPDAVVYPDGTTNKGTLQSFYDNAGNTNYYDWTTTNAALQDMGVEFEFPVPSDYRSTGNFTFNYRTSSATAANNAVDIRFYNKTNGMTLCGSSLSNATVGWTVGTVTAATLNTGCPAGANQLDPGDIVRVEVQFYSKNGGNFADVGYLNWAYSN